MRHKPSVQLLPPQRTAAPQRKIRVRVPALLRLTSRSLRMRPVSRTALRRHPCRRLFERPLQQRPQRAVRKQLPRPRRFPALWHRSQRPRAARTIQHPALWGWPARLRWPRILLPSCGHLRFPLGTLQRRIRRRQNRPQPELFDPSLPCFHPLSSWLGFRREHSRLRQTHRRCRPRKARHRLRCRNRSPRRRHPLYRLYRVLHRTW